MTDIQAQAINAKLAQLGETAMRIKAERDELAKALKETVENLEVALNGCFRSNHKQVIANARAALARVGIQ